MDGLLLDTEIISVSASQRAFRELGTEVKWKALANLVGRTQRDVARIVSAQSGYPIDIERYHSIWLDAYRQSLDAGIQLKHSVVDALNCLHVHSIPCAVVTSSARNSAISKLKRSSIGDFFEVIVGGDCVNRRKPDPEPYLLAAKMLGVQPQTCVAFEDSDLGVSSAVAAGAFVVQVPDLAPAVERKAHLRATSVMVGLHKLGFCKS
jgi:HAD superfamily hydrolase (TIGR01509 family)